MINNQSWILCCSIIFANYVCQILMGIFTEFFFAEFLSFWYDLGIFNSQHNLRSDDFKCHGKNIVFPILSIQSSGLIHSITRKKASFYFLDYCCQNSRSCSKRHFFLKKKKFSEIPKKFLRIFFPLDLIS